MEGDSGFLSRWARRKADVRQGRPLDEPVLLKPVPMPALTPKSGLDASQTPLPTAVRGTADVSKPAEEAKALAQPPSPLPPPLTLEDVKALTPQSDFKPFMAQQVQPEVRNAAMKTLFADPHYNVMDGLDIYIDDYSKSDPIPESMLRQMVSAQFLKLFDEEPTPPATVLRDSPGGALPETVAQSIDPSEPVLLPDHANTHLRLQPDHAPAGPDTGSSPA